MFSRADLLSRGTRTSDRKGYQGPCEIQAGAVCSPILGGQSPDISARRSRAKVPRPLQAASWAESERLEIKESFPLPQKQLGPREMVLSPYVEGFQPTLGKALRNLV